MKLAIADGLALPVEAATETFLVVGKRGSGKSSTATRLAERLMTAKVPIAVLDPVDVWWGLKSGADGKPGGGFPVYVFGGEHADQALEPGAGALMADTIVETRANTVFVLREFSNKEKARFVSDFAEQLFKRNRDVLHLFCEEAHEVMPQNPYAGEEEMLGRMIRLVKLGRTSGIGVTPITQRPASLNKNVTTQCEILIAHRILGPQDRAAIEDWIKFHHVAEQKAEVLASLAELKTGEAWVWAPDFPEDQPIGLKRVQVKMPETFDSRRTPKAGERRATAEVVAVDLNKLGEKMAALRKRTEENDPARLKARIRDLEREVSHRTNMPAQERTAEPRVKHVLADGQLLRAEKVLDRAVAIAGTLDGIADKVRGTIADVRKEIALVRSAPVATTGSVAPGAVRATAPRPIGRARPTPEPHTRTDAPLRSGESRDTASRGEAGLTSTHQAVLNAALFLETVGFRSPGVPQLALMSKLAPNSGYWRQIIGRLRSLGLMEGTSLTPAGRAQAVQEPLGGPQDVQDRALAVLPSETHRKVLRVLLDAYPNAYTQDRLSELSGLAVSSGYGRQIIGRLRSLGVATKGWPIAAAPFLFLEEAA